MHTEREIVIRQVLPSGETTDRSFQQRYKGRARQVRENQNDHDILSRLDIQKNGKDVGGLFRHPGALEHFLEGTGV